MKRSEFDKIENAARSTLLIVFAVAVVLALVVVR